MGAVSLSQYTHLPTKTFPARQETRWHFGKKVPDIPLLCPEAQKLAQLHNSGWAGRL
jgi:hypothetical protein